MDTLAARQQMVDQQIRTWEVLDPRVLDVLSAVPREAFVPPEYRELAFADSPIPIGFGQSMLAPKLQGRILQALAVSADDSVLEVGSGTGYLTACLEPARRRDAFDRYPCRTDRLGHGQSASRAAGHACNSRLAMPSTLRPWASSMSIAVTGSLPVYDSRFERSLRVGGRLFAVVGEAPVMDAILVRRVDNNEWIRESLFETVSRAPDQRHRGPEDSCSDASKDLTPREFLERRAGGADMTLLDVREDWETALAPVPTDIVHIPMGEISDRLGELDPQRDTVVICRSGGRSAAGGAISSPRHGFASVFNLAGGILAWSRDVDPGFPQY